MKSKAIILILRSLKDEETRKKIGIILISIFVAIFLVFTAIVYILSSPFKAIANLFSPEELSCAEEFHNEYAFVQLIDNDNEDYIYSSEFDFSSYDFENSSIEIFYYNQADSRWGNKSYGKTGTIGRCGCGPTSLAMVISTLTNKNVNPVKVSKWAYKNGYYCEGAGSYHSLIPACAEHYGLNVEGDIQDEPEELIDALSSGKLVIAIMGEGHFTSSGHFIVLRGVTEEGKILVADPISLNRSEEEWDLKIILKEARKGADAGGPFWIIGK